MKRWASSVSDISSENRATGLPYSTAAFSATLITNADFPIEGLAASTIRLPGWRPPVSSSRSLKPVGVPVIARDQLELVQLVVEDGLDRAELAGAVVVGDLEELGLGLLEQLLRRAGEG